MPRPEYETVTVYVSSQGEKNWTVKRNVDTGKLSCNCPAWIFNKKGDRTCYHTLKAELDELHSEVVKEGYRQVTSSLTSTKELPRKLKLEE